VGFDQKWRCRHISCSIHSMTSVVDRALDAMVVPGFSRIGYAVRSRAWSSFEGDELAGSTVLLTGHTSGLGRAAAHRLRSLGANLLLVGRDPVRSRNAADEVRAISGTGNVEPLVADMGELDQVARLADSVSSLTDRLDVVVHNAGALLKTRARTSRGHDATLATHVYGPFLLTHLLLDVLARSKGRVITMASSARSTTEVME